MRIIIDIAGIFQDRFDMNGTKAIIIVFIYLHMYYLSQSRKLSNMFAAFCQQENPFACCRDLGKDTQNIQVYQALYFVHPSDTLLSLRYLGHFLWNCQISQWWLVNIGLCNGLLSPATSHYLNQCWPSFMTQDGVTRPPNTYILTDTGDAN